MLPLKGGGVTIWERPPVRQRRVVSHLYLLFASGEESVLAALQTPYISSEMGLSTGLVPQALDPLSIYDL